MTFSYYRKKVTKSKSPKLHEPYFDKLEIKEIKKCIGSNFVSTADKYSKFYGESLVQNSPQEHDRSYTEHQRFPGQRPALDILWLAFPEKVYLF